MRIYDISMTLRDGIPVWPGDSPFNYQLSCLMEDGATVNLGKISTTVHAGTHVDAPIHFCSDGRSIDELDLSPFIGPALVVDVADMSVISIEAIAATEPVPGDRVLLKTCSWTDTGSFPSWFPVIAPEVPGYLSAIGVVLLGVDVPSVDEFSSKSLPNHNKLNAYGIQILESLKLAEVPPGRYELIALPLKIEGADGSPVRAILREVQGRELAHG